MHQTKSEIMILKPTAVFLSFLASQLPEHALPTLELLQTDSTAYVIRKTASEEETLAELQQHFTQMFRYEISRWLGKTARNSIENSFFDFLCCFKFEMHNHIMLMEPCIKTGRQALIIKPRTAILEWVKSSLEDMDDFVQLKDQIQLSHLVENATAVVKNFSKLADIKPFFEHSYKAVFDSSMRRMSSDKDSWPVVNSFQMFRRYFSVQIHTQLVQLQV